MLRSSFLLVSFVCISYACAQQTIIQLAAETEELYSLAALVTSEGYEAVVELLGQPGPYTLFAPNNAALEAAGIDTSDATKVIDVLKYHVIPASVKSDQLNALQFPATLLMNSTMGDSKGQALGVSKNGTQVHVMYGLDKAVVVQADIMASNGIIHIVDKVLMPPKSISETAAAAGSFTTLVALLTKANLTSIVDSLKGATVFAPTDDAFKKLGNKTEGITAEKLKAILSYHVVPSVAYSTDVKDGATLKTVEGGTVKLTVSGTGVGVNDAKVVMADVLTANGVVHAVDTVLMPGTSGGAPTNPMPNPSSANVRVRPWVPLLSAAGIVFAMSSVVTM